MTLLVSTFRAAVVASVCFAFAGHAAAATPYKTLGQPNLNGKTLGSRCAPADAKFNFLNDGGFAMHGPSGIAIDPRGRVFVTDFGGRRVLTWPNFEALQPARRRMP